MTRLIWAVLALLGLGLMAGSLVYADTPNLGLFYGSTERENKNLDVIDAVLGSLTPSTLGGIKAELRAGPPPVDLCDVALEYGRLMVDTTFGGQLFYVCTPTGWVFIPIGDTAWIFPSFVEIDSTLRLRTGGVAAPFADLTTTVQDQLTVTDLHVDDDLVVDSDATISDDLTVTDDVTINGDITTVDSITLDGTGSGTVPITQTVGDTATVVGSLGVTGNLQVETAIQSGGGMQHGRQTTGSINAGASAAVTLTWGVAFASAALYTVTCDVLDATTAIAALHVDHIESKTETTVVVRVSNTAAGALTGTLMCIAMSN